LSTEEVGTAAGREVKGTGGAGTRRRGAGRGSQKLVQETGFSPPAEVHYKFAGAAGARQ